MLITGLVLGQDGGRWRASSESNLLSTAIHKTLIPEYREHLYRRHRIPVRCSRCGEIFKHQDNLNAHLRNQVPCHIRPEEPIEGVTADTEKRLKCRKKAWPNQTEEDRWREVYQILFPYEEVPSPCKLITKFLRRANILTISDYEHDNEIATFDNYSSRETPRVFLGLLENRASTNRLTQETKDELVDMVQECRRFVYRQFRRSETQNTPPPPILSTVLENVIPNSRSSISQDDNVISTEATQVQAGTLHCSDFDSADFDPEDFQSIFLNQSTLDWDPFGINNIISSQKQCYCITSCSCPPSAPFEFPADKCEHSQSTDLQEEMKRLKQENEDLKRQFEREKRIY